jgi:hypothetical protein
MQYCKRLFSSLFFLPIAIAGCSFEPAKPPTFPVSGVVTLDGKPVEGVVVTFVPRVTGTVSSATGSTDAAGKYQLTTFSGNDGAQEGDFDVKVSKYGYKETEEAGDGTTITSAEEYQAAMKKSYEAKNPMTPGAVPKNSLPAKYENHNTSGLKYSVKKPGGTFDIPLKK